MFHKKNFELHQNYMEDTFNLAVLGFQWLWVKQKRNQIKRAAYTIALN